MSYQIVNEGKARLFVYALERYKVSSNEYVPSKAAVFYNPLMRTNRDMMISVLKTAAQIDNRKFSMGEPMAGVGVRSMRALLETEAVGFAYVNDLNEEAYALMQKNTAMNGLSNRTQVTNLNATAFLANHSHGFDKFDYVDLDPFGSPAPHLEQTVSSLGHEGLMGVTATDTAVLFGAHPKKTRLRYGSFVERVPFMKEVGIRVLIGSTVLTAARHQLGIVPLLCYSERHYLRAYFRILKSRAVALKALENVGYLIFSRSPLEWTTVRSQDLGTEIGKLRHESSKIYGPLWIGNYVDRGFARAMTEFGAGVSSDSDRIVGALLEEASDIVGYYSNSLFVKQFNGNIPSPNLLVEIAKRHGLTASRTHLDSNAIKVNLQLEEFARILG